MSKPSVEDVRDSIMYDKTSGVAMWKTRPRDKFESENGWVMWNSKYAGKRCGTDNNGYVVVRFQGKSYPLHHLAFVIEDGFWVTEKYCDKEVDHINGVTDDNSYNNLRIVSREENARNHKNRVTNSSGVRGVYRGSHKGEPYHWVACITHNKKRQSKMFRSFDEAVEWRKSKEVECGYHENCGR